ncbi:hypothetical protein OB919_01155 [Halobacteria archaeon AArc-curdl1]|uniref:Uncharacterized protein n=1 Tax=Natronosalvus hydrolyticus TaxID=2979988 RepID=A0AAP2Z4H8_9EURY|nr:hypothetical protein [Halobacteria archaeon AArc-curdl1]
MTLDLSAYDHPSWFTVVGTGAGYLLILAIMTLVLFGLPWLAFATL